MEIFTEQFETCNIIGPYQNDDADNFEPGDFNRYPGSELQECQDFNVPNYNRPLMQLSNCDNSNVWIVDLVRVFFCDEGYAECPLGEALVGNAQVAVQCELKVTLCGKSTYRYSA